VKILYSAQKNNTINAAIIPLADETALRTTELLSY